MTPTPAQNSSNGPQGSNRVQINSNGLKLLRNGIETITIPDWPSASRHIFNTTYISETK
ncbi:hypothetical protein GCM10007895_00560 [Paraferrimonas sedimenticola]|uniref:Uncharacterized protein n=1 Tax=Paraferrimonas sedimenticola TaxID=375674 RepID=A0AA37VWE5_9GAMM|nr:hypothetical protein GCM10007895_00560 [Paraferrimonas sedimenticola]